MKNEFGFGCGLYIVILGTLVLIVASASLFLQRGKVEVVEGTVTNKYIDDYDRSLYLYIEIESDNGTYTLQNQDAFWWGKWNEVEVQQEIVVGGRYSLTVAGWQIGHRWYPNVVKYHRLDG